MDVNFKFEGPWPSLLMTTIFETQSLQVQLQIVMILEIKNILVEVSGGGDSRDSKSPNLGHGGYGGSEPLARGIWWR